MDTQPVETTLYSLKESVPEPAQRRSSQRHLSLLRVGTLVIGNRRELCLIRNVSAGGMMIRAYSHIAVGTRVSIELKHGEPVSGITRWRDGENVGVSFDAPVDILSLITPPQGGPPPRMPRMEVSCTVSLRQDGTVHRAKALNISQGGLCAESQADLKVGAEVIISLNGLPPMPALVKWHDAGLYGVGFNRMLALSELVAWLQQYQQQPRRANG